MIPCYNKEWSANQFINIYLPNYIITPKYFTVKKLTKKVITKEWSHEYGRTDAAKRTEAS